MSMVEVGEADAKTPGVRPGVLCRNVEFGKLTT